MSANNAKTFLAYNRVWHLIDARDLILGRMANDIAVKLMGKHKPIFHPAADAGDYVVVINAANVAVSGRKSTQKEYKYHTGHPGGLKTVSYSRMMDLKPQKIIEKAVYGMLPKNKTRAKRMSRLKIFSDSINPYEANIKKEYF